MSRSAAIEEVEDEEFDDDTDLPLPSLPNTGSHGPILQELDIPLSPTPGPSPSPSPRPPARQPSAPKQGETSTAHENVTTDPVTGRKVVWVQDDSAYKNWTSIYPIYIDAKRPYKGSERRVPREKSVWWPLSSDIVEACAQLGLKTLHEPTKQHPRDWENPGRVKVCFKADGRLQHNVIQTKKQLLMAIATNVQRLNPDLVPGATPAPAADDPTAAAAPKSRPPAKTRPSRPRTPAPRLRRPAQDANVLVETVKAGMSALPPGEGAPSNSPAAPGGKGKRKVIRVRQ
ncbi:signal recognition particle, SRP19 subunit [Hysterangium stoloniferum]|nr:signal recognition particle, SRP19 subunit [Hysterangium stoloniferum]